jgi:hypothetical protein
VRGQSTAHPLKVEVTNPLLIGSDGTGPVLRFIVQPGRGSLSPLVGGVEEQFLDAEGNVVQLNLNSAGGVAAVNLTPQGEGPWFVGVFDDFQTDGGFAIGAPEMRFVRDAAGGPAPALQVSAMPDVSEQSAEVRFGIQILGPTGAQAPGIALGAVGADFKPRAGIPNAVAPVAAVVATAKTATVQGKFDVFQPSTTFAGTAQLALFDETVTLPGGVQTLQTTRSGMIEAASMLGQDGMKTRIKRLYGRNADVEKSELIVPNLPTALLRLSGVLFGELLPGPISQKGREEGEAFPPRSTGRVPPCHTPMASSYVPAGSHGFDR